MITMPVWLFILLTVLAVISGAVGLLIAALITAAAGDHVPRVKDGP